MSKKIKTHTLVTIEDICRIVTKYNFEQLATDILDCIHFHIKLKEILSKEEYDSMQINGIEWKNDGVKGMTSIKVNDKIINVKPLKK